MHWRWQPTALLILVLSGQVVLGADLATIRRTIAREPAYQSKPKYCLLVFGLEAQTRVWLVLDGKVLYVDRNGDGDLTSPGKRVENKSKNSSKYLYFSAGDIPTKDVKIRYEDLRLEWISEEKFEIWVCVNLGWKRGGPSPRPLEEGAEPARWPSPRAALRFADRPQDAPIVHFDGPLTFALAKDKQVLVRGAGPSSVEVMLGTQGLGRGAITSFIFWPGDAPATAAIAFPNRDPAGKPIVVQVPLLPGWNGHKF